MIIAKIKTTEGAPGCINHDDTRLSQAHWREVDQGELSFLDEVTKLVVETEVVDKAPVKKAIEEGKTPTFGEEDTPIRLKPEKDKANTNNVRIEAKKK